MSTTFERIDLDQYDGITPGEWVVGRANSGPVSGTTPVNTPGYDSDGYRDGALVCSVYGTQLRSARNARAIADVPRLLAALKAAYAEIDRLRANALDWKIVTEDPATLPRPEETVIVRQLDGTAPWPTCRVPDREEWDEMWLVGDDGGLLILPGDRWAYIPEVQ